MYYHHHCHCAGYCTPPNPHYIETQRGGTIITSSIGCTYIHAGAAEETKPALAEATAHVNMWWKVRMNPAPLL